MMTYSKYILNEKGEPVEEKDLLKWARWFEDSNHSRIVAKTKVGKYEVSTVFLALDFAFDGGTPLIFETMVFEPMTKKHADNLNKPIIMSDGREFKGYQFKAGDRKEAEKFDTRRYHTREEALKGHEEIVTQIRKKLKRKK